MRDVGSRLFAAGFTDLVSVIPPGATLTPTSTVPQAAIGKAPGRKLGSGLWAGYDWRRHIATSADVAQWAADGASLGLRADRHPGVDIDVMDPQLAGIIQDVAFARLGRVPVRTGRAPKRLLTYATAEPFSRMRLHISDKGGEHLVEILGKGQQYLVAGIHPGTMRPYLWDCEWEYWEPRQVTREQCVAFLDDLTETLEMLGCVVSREGDGRNVDRVARDPGSLEAPSLAVLAEAVAKIPNTNELFASRDEYIKMGVAIRAACGDAIEDGFALFAAWADTWEGNHNGPNRPEIVRADWQRIRPPFAIGWNWLAEQARAFGFTDAAVDFEALEDARAEEPESRPPEYSDQWLANAVITARRSELRFVPANGTYLVWDGARWKVDADLLAESIIDDELCKIADRLMRVGATPAEKAKAKGLATQICSAGKANSVATVARRNRAIAVPVDKLDHDQWLLNTPGGIVDLRTGVLGPPDPDALCTKSTSVAPDMSHDPGRWLDFLYEATGGDIAVMDYLRRLAGYCLTGSTREQHLTFVYGPGGSGKSTFLSVLSGVLHEYARTATMDTFTASTSEKHSTDIAMLLGARLVTASETTAGKRWDEARVKQLTGGDKVTARFMRENNVTFVPRFKLVFVGNHKPEIRDVDGAMRRRIQMVPFTHTPKTVDNELGAKLEAEYAAILGWMIAGCLEWQLEGLNPPEAIRGATREYLREQDTVGAWLEECTEPGDEGVTSTALFDNWREWCGRNGQYPATLVRLVDALKAKKYEPWRDNVTRRRGFVGLALVKQAGFGVD